MGRASRKKKFNKLKGETRSAHLQPSGNKPCIQTIDEPKHGVSCPIPNTHARLQEAHRLWHQAMDMYFDPEGFRINLNACIQSLRNITFVLQKEKSNIPDFDQWYATWQTKMKGDKVLRWLVDARNTIVKKGDLETKSRAKVTIIAQYNSTSPVLVLEMPPFLSTAQLATQLAASKLVPSELKKKGFLRVERRWVAADLEDTELLDALAHVYGMLSLMLDEAHARAGGGPVLLFERKENGRFDLWKGSTEHLQGQMPCMVTSVEKRTILAEIGSGNIARTMEIAFKPDPKQREKVEKRYANIVISPALKMGGSPLAEQAEMLFDHAKQILQKDGYHLTLAFLRANGKGLGIVNLQPEVRHDKYVLMRQLALQVEKYGADEVLLISESWMAFANPKHPDRPAGESPDRFEALNLLATSAKGEEISLSSVFRRKGKNGKIIEFEETSRKIMGPAPILEPIREVWRMRKKESTSDQSTPGSQGQK